MLTHRSLSDSVGVSHESGADMKYTENASIYIYVYFSQNEDLQCVCLTCWLISFVFSVISIFHSNFYSS